MAESREAELLAVIKGLVELSAEAIQAKRLIAPEDVLDEIGTSLQLEVSFPQRVAPPTAATKQQALFDVATVAGPTVIIPTGPCWAYYGKREHEPHIWGDPPATKRCPGVELPPSSERCDYCGSGSKAIRSKTRVDGRLETCPAKWHDS